MFPFSGILRYFSANFKHYTLPLPCKIQTFWAILGTRSTTSSIFMKMIDEAPLEKTFFFLLYRIITAKNKILLDFLGS